MVKLFFIILGLGIGLVASFYYISSSLDSLSDLPPAITVEHLLVRTPKELEELHDSKCRELAKILKQVTNQPSATKHRAAAQHAFIQMEMIRTRAEMLPSPAQTGLHPRSNPASGTAELRNECRRLASLAPQVRSELRTILDPINSQIRAFQATPPAQTDAR